ncbi:MAG: sulfite exporter TauE/SafE family protein [Acidimicrobiales bacterium]
MNELWIAGLAGFAASLVDGALGMGFGPTSSSLLLASGMSPITTSASVNLAKIATGLAGAVSHWRFGNLDRRLVLQLAIPGASGAVVGALVLSFVDEDGLRPILASMLVLIGLRIMVRFSRALPVASSADPKADCANDTPNSRGVRLAGLTGGVTNGLVGAWGPVVTPVMLERGIVPRIAVGSVNTAEVAVAVVSVGSIIGSVGGDGFELGVVAAMVAGGVIAAPLGAYAVRFFPARLLGLGVAAVLLVTQVRELDRVIDHPRFGLVAYVAAIVGIALAGLRPRLTRTAQRGSQASLSSTSERTSGGR